MSFMNLEEALRSAIEAELAAARFYAQLAQNTSDPRARDFLHSLVSEELDHAERVELLALTCANRALSFRPDRQIDRIETVPEWLAVDNITYEQAVDVALEAEVHASLFYRALADHAPDDMAKLLASFADTEDEHADSLRRKRDELRAHMMIDYFSC